MSGHGARTLEGGLCCRMNKKCKSSLLHCETLLRCETDIRTCASMEEVGRGGYGIVYARDDSVVKTEPDYGCGIPPTAAMDIFARALCKGTGCVPITAISRSGKCGRTWEMLQPHAGTPLSELPAPFPVDFCARITIEVCDVLARLHGKGMIHNDIKPHHIMMMDDDISLIDFGIATRDDDGRMDAQVEAFKDPDLTARRQVSCRESDMWAMGVTLWWCLTGDLLMEKAPTGLTGRLRRCMKRASDNGTELHIPPSIPMNRVLELMLQPDRRMRGTAEECVIEAESVLRLMLENVK